MSVKDIYQEKDEVVQAADKVKEEYKTYVVLHRKRVEILKNGRSVIGARTVAFADKQKVFLRFNKNSLENAVRTILKSYDFDVSNYRVCQYLNNEAKEDLEGRCRANKKYMSLGRVEKM